VSTEIILTAFLTALCAAQCRFISPRNAALEKEKKIQKERENILKVEKRELP
jgi:hypothetical protein